jgi:hypothetical protein
MIVAATLLVGCDGDDGTATGGDARTTSAEPSTSGDGGGLDRGRRPALGDGVGGVELVEIGEFDQPLYVTQPRSGDAGHIYVVEQCGRVLRVPLGGGEPETFLDISDRVSCGTEQGLLSVAFAPDYARSGLLYVDYTDTEGDTRVVEYQRDDDEPSRVDPDSARELLFVDQPYPNHNGGLVVFGPDGRLYIGLGDGGSADDPHRNGQDLGTLLGKILRIDPQPSGDRPYSIPEDNPHLEDGSARPEIAIHGLRNPWRFSFDRLTLDLWIADVGQNALEEIDTAAFEEVTGLDSGLNFGWSAFEGTARFNDDEAAPGARPPVHEYGRDRGCSVTGGYVVRDPELRSVYGRYVYGDYCVGELYSIVARRPGDEAPGLAPPEDQPLGVEVPSLSSFGEDAAGHIYATSLEGPVYRLEPAE